MQSKNKDWFHFSSYWRTWSRVILRGGGTFSHQVAIPLTPVNDTAGEWDEIKRISIIRTDMRYGIPDKKDIWTHELPEEAYRELSLVVGKAQADFMIHSSLMDLIDWNDFNRYSDGRKCPYGLCEKKFKFPWVDVVSKENLHSVVSSDKLHFCMKYEIADIPGVIPAGGYSHQTEDTHLLMHAEYDTVNRLISINFNVSTPDGDSITRVSKRIGEGWRDSAFKQLDIYKHMFGFDEESIWTAKDTLDKIKLSILILG